MKQYIAYKTTEKGSRILDVNVDSFNRAKKIIKEDYEDNYWRDGWVEYGIEIWKLNPHKRVFEFRDKYEFNIYLKEFEQVK